MGEYLRSEISSRFKVGAFIGVRDGHEMDSVADVKGWTVQRVAAESCVPLGRRIEPNALDMFRLMRRLQSKQKASALDKKRPPAIEGEFAVGLGFDCSVELLIACLI